MKDPQEEILSILRNIGFENLCDGHSIGDGKRVYSNVAAKKIQTGENEYFFEIQITSLKIDDYVMPQDNTVLKNSAVEFQIKEMEYKMNRNRAKDSFISLINRYMNSLPSKYPYNIKDKNFSNEIDKCNNLLNKVRADNPKMKVYKDDIPMSLLSQGETQEYFKYYFVEKTDPNIISIGRHPDSDLPEYVIKERERQKALQKMRENWEAADPVASQIVSGMAYGAAIAGTVATLYYAPQIAARYFVAASGTEMLWYKVAANVGYQYISSGGNLKNIEVVSIIVIPFSPVVKGVIPSGIQIRPFSDDDALRTVGNEISWDEFLFNSAVSVGVEKGKRAAWKQLKPYYDKTVDKTVVYSTVIDIPAKVMSKEAKDTYKNK